MEDIAFLKWLGTFAAVGLIWACGRRFYRLRHIPTVGGPSLPILSYLGVIRLMHDARNMLHEGYNKHYGSLFKVAFPNQWFVVVTGDKLIDELRRLPDDVALFKDAIKDLLELDTTIGPAFHADPYHIDVIRTQLTRGIGNAFPSLYNEIEDAFEELLPVYANQWTVVDDMLQKLQRITARVSNRAFVGMPICRNNTYLDLVIQHTMDIAWTRKRMILIPRFLKPLAAMFFSRALNDINQGHELLLPVLVERRNKFDNQEKDPASGPSDYLDCLMEAALLRGKGLESVTQMIFATNFAAIHTSSNSMMYFLYDVAAHPDCIPSLREEIQEVVRGQGWTKDAVGKLLKLDSFMRESQRFNGTSAISVMRKSVKGVTFSNGQYVPPGVVMVVPAREIHFDSRVYDNPDVFDPLRFYTMRANGVNEQFANTSTSYVAFGLGKHACPGRFFASCELKAMAAHLLLHYDWKFETGKDRPENRWFAVSVMPDTDVKLLFKKREW